MPLEIERKFFVPDTSFLQGRKGVRLRQAYLASGALTVRVRVAEDGRAWLTCKGTAQGMSRAEFEYAVPLEDALAMAALPGVRMLEKVRYAVDFDGCTWDVDVYEGELSGLHTAEVEAFSEDAAAKVLLPSWVGQELTGQRAWDNDMLASSGRPCGF